MAIWEAVERIIIMLWRYVIIVISNDLSNALLVSIQTGLRYPASRLGLSFESLSKLVNASRYVEVHFNYLKPGTVTEIETD